MSTDPFPSARQADVFRHVRRRIPGPLGCLALVLLMPFLLFGLLIASFFMRRKVSGARQRMQRAPRTPQELERETALCSFVRYLALDAQFTREEALGVPVIVSSGAAPPVAELLDEAEARGWVRGDAERMEVTQAGRTAAARFLDQQGI